MYIHEVLHNGPDYGLASHECGSLHKKKKKKKKKKKIEAFLLPGLQICGVLY